MNKNLPLAIALLVITITLTVCTYFIVDALSDIWVALIHIGVTLDHWRD